ncbi:TMEM165/GDT1 family protein [Erythrobacter sp. THAF29]|uniref:TMEM165/GDT1 family protein n=1 Tax=Erythrobacter sp. THAF29 TaxID=2587851 RepID=UPI001268FFAD|nr:TMEM165/GDT1 family protein [Erythrobacter sp. THAF29]
MDTFLISMLLTFAIALGGREQLVVAQFSDAVGRSVPLLLTGIACAAVSAGVMGWAGWSVAAMLPDRAADMLVAIALAIAAFELSWEVKLKDMKEPTRSYVAIAVVLFVRQAMDAARFVIFALAAQAVYPVTIIIGGALGGAAAVALGWMLGKRKIKRLPLRAIRLLFAFITIVSALFIGLSARYAVY